MDESRFLPGPYQQEWLTPGTDDALQSIDFLC